MTEEEMKEVEKLLKDESFPFIPGWKDKGIVERLLEVIYKARGDGFSHRNEIEE